MRGFLRVADATVHGGQFLDALEINNLGVDIKNFFIPEMGQAAVILPQSHAFCG
jgi:hypothetical protein